MPPAQSAAPAPNPWWVGVVAGMASYIDAAAIVGSGTALVLYQQAIGVTPTEIGVLSAALTLCIAVGALIGGRLGDAFGRRSVFIVTMAMIVVGAALLVLSGGFIGLLTGTILVGLGSGADLPVSLATISEAATDGNRGKLISFSQILWFAGIAATIALSAAVGDLGYLGGQILFGHAGVVALAVLLLRLTIPESSSWRAAHRERRSGARTVRAERHGIRDVLTERTYLVPFLALLVFYSLTNLGANTKGQFSTYIAVNVVGLTVQTASFIALAGLPLGLLFALWFMRVSDGPRRMTYYVVGAFFLVAAYGIPAAFGFSLPTIMIAALCGAIGGSWAFEAIMKIWAQESFPTLLRASAQGAIIAVARVAASALAVVTPALLTSPRLMYALLTALVAAGLLAGWLAFHKSQVNVFRIEDKDLAEAGQESRASGLRKDAPATDA
ncbi:inositol transporter-like SP family MFS transporter [Thermocatellispora tengchongensis]|uniref:Inositol transporter-like SP family MFS transporter n=1 Tax=Thermocatellispora tengchongensis TaxID=1073253 RepID=A0A840P7D6_9ACTN|nr:MFS transporter [Thermocatellispora tengchongensis]MBB5133823.1 inositol transporter-like SP family MFS transporter [Thermocatellispora tengchongensis]